MVSHLAKKEIHRLTAARQNYDIDTKEYLFTEQSFLNK